MLKRYAIISLFICAYTIVLGHSIIPHHHHDLTEATEHHDDDNHDHSLFSFGTIEVNFIPANHQVTINSDITIQLFTLLNNFSLIDAALYKRDVVYSTYQESLSSENYLYSCSLRAPPIC